MKDIYDEEIERLTANPEQIESSWTEATPLFKFVSTSQSIRHYLGSNNGCLTMIKDFGASAQIHPDIDYELTVAIRNDERIPRKPLNITVEHLPVFAEWQRKIDKLIEEYKDK